MKKPIQIYVFVSLLFITGCGGHITKFYRYNNNTEKQIGSIKQDSRGSASVKDGDLEMSVDTRELSWWNKYITPVFMGAAGQSANASE